jgi:hypothetical protein
MDARTRASASISEAKKELDRALVEIDLIQTFDPALVGLFAHALSNYITVTSATVEMLQLSLRDFHDPDVPIWLEGIGRTADLMQHSVSRLVSMSTPRDFPLKLDRVNLAVLHERACEYYRQRFLRRAGPDHLPGGRPGAARVGRSRRGGGRRRQPVVERGAVVGRARGRPRPGPGGAGPRGGQHQGFRAGLDRGAAGAHL